MAKGPASELPGYVSFNRPPVGIFAAAEKRPGPAGALESLYGLDGLVFQ